MKITPFKIKEFLKNPGSAQGLLIHGNDPGQIDFYSRNIIDTLNKNEEFTICKIEFCDVNKSPGLLFTELVNITIFNKKKLVLLINVTDKISEELKKILNNHIGNNYVLMIAKATLAQRSYFENAKNLAVIGCYKDSNNNLHDIILAYLKQNNISYTDETIAELQRCLSNSFSFYLELEKLITYLGDKKHVKISDIKKCFGSKTYDVAVDDLCSAIVEKNINDFIKYSNILMAYGNFSSIALLRIISRYFMRLSTVLNAIKSGIDEQEAIKMLDPPLFFKQLPVFKKHVRNIDHLRVKVILQGLLELEIISKQTDVDSKLIFQHNIMSMLLA
ncbi:DNA polymerase III subunit delta [Candidatus Mesenet endosymbiont of Phosphuga atrata]|uniref:DNA polymerase III subunit delta n=1 Tax=Candidatus Mesenet endosymbiont of Phosphuga atrata TaxID=3066221 RepID=UPI0030D1BDC9